jgi:PIN domain nuclease of toxin-antitoxin system
MLLDTHAFYWLAGERHQLGARALVAIAESQQINSLYLCPISAWELLIAAQKLRNAPHWATSLSRRGFGLSDGKWQPG